MITVFDPSSSLARLGNDNHLFRTLVLFFQEDCPDLLRQIREGIERDNAVQVERAAHNLYGLVASFSADGALDAVQQVAEGAREDNLRLAQERLPELELQIDRLRAALCSYVDGLCS